MAGRIHKMIPEFISFFDEFGPANFPNLQYIFCWLSSNMIQLYDVDELSDSLASATANGIFITLRKMII